MKIEFAKFSDYPKGTMYRLLEDAYAYEPGFKRDFDANWKDADGFFCDHPEIADECGFITTADGLPIGCICWDPRHIPDYVELGHNCVASRYKGLKIGKLQLREAVRRISEKKVPVIRVTTNEALLPARKNYESAGFRLKGKRDDGALKAYSGALMDYELEV